MIRILIYNNFIKCKSDQDVKTVRSFKICTWADCRYRNSNITDEGLYLGRVQININDGKKRKYLYFQADYKLKSFDFENGGDGGGNDGGDPDGTPN